LELARNQLRPDCSRIKFARRGMLDLTEFAAEQNLSFDVASIVGNTLVHLESPEQIGECLRQLRRILRAGGIFIFQIINYDRIFSTGEFFLPTIETKNCRFERLYEKQTGIEQLIFHTRLQICASGQVLENRIPLYPLRFSELNKALKEAGFDNIKYFGSFAGDPLTDESTPLVGLAS
jgi:SAM-dependent methyltransferase